MSLYLYDACATWQNLQFGSLHCFWPLTLQYGGPFTSNTPYNQRNIVVKDMVTF